MNCPPQPAAWSAADFDDSQWQRQRKPFLVGTPAVGFGVQNCGVRTACFCARFFVLYPARAGELSLRRTYRGGVRVLLNGKEIGRGHLPGGSKEVSPAHPTTGAGS